MDPVTIKLNLRFGDINRLRIAEISNLSILILSAPRSDFDSLLGRKELAYAGVYLLLGTENGKKKPLAYIGEAENLGDRLKQHTEKDFWTNAFILTDKDESLTKAHIRYLEGRLIPIAKSAGRYDIQNTQGSGAKLPESDRDSLEFYLSWVCKILPALGCDLFIPSGEIPEPTKPEVPESIKFVRAIEELGGAVNPKQMEMLRAHYHAKSRRLTARQLAEQVGYAGYGAANLHYGKLGRLIGKKIGLPDADCHIGVLVDFIRPNTEGNNEWIWIMRPELAKALEVLGWV